MTKKYRNRLEIYCDILEEIQNEQINPKGVKLTNIQKKVGMSYDKLVKYLKVLKRKKLIMCEIPIKNSDKGIRFVNDCIILKKHIKLMHKKYLN